jgi:hypothetical protein
VIRLYQWTPKNTHVVKISINYISAIHSCLFHNVCTYQITKTPSVPEFIMTAAAIYCKQTLGRSIWMTKLCTIRNNLGTIKHIFLVRLFVTYLLSYRRRESYYSLWRRCIVNMSMCISCQEKKQGFLNTKPTKGFKDGLRMCSWSYNKTDLEGTRINISERTHQIALKSLPRFLEN